MLVAGVDSSTQSTKVLLCQADDGTVVGQATSPHPDGTECDPELWWRSLAQAGDGLLNRADAIGVAAQQHGMVVVDDAGQVIRPALLWNDVRSAPQARTLIAELGGPLRWAELTGSVPTASFTVTKLRWLADHEPDAAARTAHVMLPHDWLSWRLGERAHAPATDRGDASGTGYFSPATGRWLPELAEAALGKPAGLPRVAAPAEIVARTPGGAALSPEPGTTCAQHSDCVSASGRWSSRSAPRAPRTRSRPGPPPTRPGPWPASPTPPGASCRWWPRSTRPGC